MTRKMRHTGPAFGSRSSKLAEDFKNWPLVLVIHVNSFTRKITSGYLLVHGQRNGGMMTATQCANILAADPHTPVEFLSV